MIIWQVTWTNANYTHVHMENDIVCTVWQVVSEGMIKMNTDFLRSNPFCFLSVKLKEE